MSELDGMLALALVFVVFAIGDYISDKTRAVFSVLLVATIIFVILFWSGIIPGSIFDDAGITAMSVMMRGMFIVNMGTLLSMDEFIAQWKTVVLGLMIVIIGGVLMLVVATPFIGQNLAVAIVGPITGGIVSAMVVNEVAMPLGLTDVALTATIIVAVQGIIGYPLASILLKKEAIRLKNGYHNGTIQWTPADKEEEQTSSARKRPWRIFKPMPPRMMTPFILLAKCSIVSLIAFQLSNLTNGAIHRYVMCLIMGVVFREIGFLEHEVMKKASAFGLGSLFTMTAILTNLTSITPQQLVSMITPLIIAFIIGICSLFVVAFLGGKLFGYSWQMACGIATSCLFGFPGTYVVSNEIANKVGENEEEVQMLLDNILPKMLIAGFVCLTMTSVILTGFIVRLL